MKIASGLNEVYDAYYGSDPGLSRKRAIAARQSVRHVTSMLHERPYGTLLDIGAGEGAVLAELDRLGFADEYHAAEISSSGVAAIRARRLSSLRSVRQFDGYSIDTPADCYDVGTAIHVLEHVEHERAFIKEITRVCRLVYIEVPLELTANVEAFIRAGRPYGHINFYNISLFQNLLCTAGADILDLRMFPNSREYEVHLSGTVKGSLKHLIRTGLLRFSPTVANYAMSYVAGAVCRRAKPPH